MHCVKMSRIPNFGIIRLFESGGFVNILSHTRGIKSFFERRGPVTAIDSTLSRKVLNGEVVATDIPWKETTYRGEKMSLNNFNGIHKEMLVSEVRSLTYQNAIFNNKQLFHRKTVLDVGCGTGILSMVAAKAGASQVFGIECSGIAELAEKRIKENNLDHVITIFKGKVEEVEIPIQKVDIIISEFMGYSLFYESMLNTILYSRNKWLKPGGMMFPTRESFCSIKDGHNRNMEVNCKCIAFFKGWDDLNYFNMTSVGKLNISTHLLRLESRSLVFSDCPLKILQDQISNQDIKSSAKSLTNLVKMVRKIMWDFNFPEDEMNRQKIDKILVTVIIICAIPVIWMGGRCYEVCKQESE